MKKLGIISPHIFEDKLILSFSKNWMNQFGKVPEFDIFMDKNKLHLISKQKVTKSGGVL